MALLDELMANQLLQGMQKKDPRAYDLLNIMIKNIKNIAVETGVDSPRTLARSTTIGRSTTVIDASAVNIYQIQKRVSIRL